LATIEEVFSRNLKTLRGVRTQAEIAELADIPLRSYQRAEYGEIPQQPNREAIAKAYGVPVNSLFIDPELRQITPQEAVRVLAEFVAKTERNEAIAREAEEIRRELFPEKTGSKAPLSKRRGNTRGE
jgi:transcriptional regulator with XRE-family HTH domain